jgi:hypothetical protein
MQRGLAHALPLFLLAGLCLSGLDATGKYLVRDHSLLRVVWARYAGQMLFVTPFAWHRAGRSFWHTRRLPLHLVRSLMLVLATLGFFGGLRYLPLAEASAITFLAPIFIVALSWPLLREHAPAARRIASVAGFAGILILLRPGSAVMHPAVLLLVGAALANALYQLLTRKLLDERPNTTLFYSATRHRRAFAGARGHARAAAARRLGTVAVPADGTPCGARPLVPDARLHARTGVAADAVHVPADPVGDGAGSRRLRPASGRHVRDRNVAHRRERALACVVGTPTRAAAIIMG